MEDRIRQKLEVEFSPEELEIIDESESHLGHAGYRDGGQTHFRLRMRAARLSGKSRIAQQRAVYACLKEELEAEDGIHALALDVSG